MSANCLFVYCLLHLCIRMFIVFLCNIKHCNDSSPCWDLDWTIKSYLILSYLILCGKKTSACPGPSHFHQYFVYYSISIFLSHLKTENINPNKQIHYSISFVYLFHLKHTLRISSNPTFWIKKV